MAIQERGITLLIFTALIFIVINYDLQFGVFFLAFATANALLYLFDSKVDFVFERVGNNKLKSLGITVFAYFGYRIITTVVSQLSDVQTVKLFGDSIFLFTQAPILQGSPILYVIGEGLLVPLAETPFFNGRLYEGLADLAHIDGTRFSIKTILLALIIGAIATTFHFSVRGIGNASFIGLLITALFFIFSQLLVIFTGQLFEGTLLHMVANTTAAILYVGINSIEPAWPVVIGIIIVIGLNAIDLSKLRSIRSLITPGGK